LRGTILIELSLRNRINTIKDPRNFSIADRIIQVNDETSTGEVLLDETLRFLKADNDSIANWIDLLSGIDV
jgi:Golgi phosphoprotein 3